MKKKLERLYNKQCWVRLCIISCLYGIGRGMLKILLGIYMNEWMKCRFWFLFFCYCTPLDFFLFIFIFCYFFFLHTLDSNNKYISYLFIACCAFQNVFIVHWRFSINFIDKYFVFSKFLLDKRILITK